MDALAQARAATDTNPTPAQIEAGNYRKGELTLHGLRIKLENPRGSIRRSKPGTKPAWERRMVHDYGYVCGIEGADGDAVDVFIGPDPDSELAVVVDQVNADGSFDESKCLLGFRSAEAAIAGYLAHYPKGWALGPVTVLTVAQLKEWLTSSKTTQAINGRVVVMIKSRQIKGGKNRLGVDKRGRGHWLKPEGVLSRETQIKKTLIRSPFIATSQIVHAEQAARIFRRAMRRREALWAVHMDKAARPKAVEVVAVGELSRVPSHPREVFANALRMGTSALALIHSHPSGKEDPSAEDRQVAGVLADVGREVGVPVRFQLAIAHDGFGDLITGKKSPWMSAGMRTRWVPLVEEREIRVPVPQSWQGTLEQPMRSGAEVANVGRAILSLGEPSGMLAFLRDADRKVFGVFPLGYGEESVNGLLKLAIANSASSVILAANLGSSTEHQVFTTFARRARAALAPARIVLAEAVEVGTSTHAPVVESDTRSRA